MRALIVLSALIAAPALAWHGQADFQKRAIEGGGDGMFYTGSIRTRRFDCSLCHVDAEHRMRLTLDADPPGLVSEGVYTPGATYALTVTMVGEHRGLGSALNPNTFVMEILDAEGVPAGIFTGLDAGTERPPGEELVVARGEFDDATRWSFEWVAPEAPASPLTLHLVGVDGDGAEGRLGRTGDPFGDDVFVGALSLDTDRVPLPASSGCSVGPAGSIPWISFGFAFAWLAAWRRRSRWALGACVLLAVGCHDPVVDFDDCPRGICPGDVGRDDRDVGDAARVDAPLLDAPRLDGEVEVDGGTDSGPPPDGCVPRWSCSTWASACDGGDEATRECVDASGCGTDSGRPPTTTTLASLDERFYRCRVQPIVDRTCAQMACHGTEDRPLRLYSRGKWRINADWRGNHVDRSPGLTDPEWCRNFDSARSFASSDASRSELLTQPLQPTLGGLPHSGFTLFYGVGEGDYQTIQQWLEGATLPSCDTGFN